MSIPIFFIYKDTLDPPDYYDQILFIVKSSFDQLIFTNGSAIKSLGSEFAAYEGIDVKISEFSMNETQWLINAVINFNQPIKLTEYFLDSILNILASEADFKIIPNLNTSGK
jgi:hypothetical protein